MNEDNAYVCPRCDVGIVFSNMSICDKCKSEIVREDKEIQGEI